jgi:alkylation response protein AidB-like acyl-CoA dehydrogenase
MDFSWTEEQELLRSNARRYLERECPPEKIREWDSKAEYPQHVFDQMAELGWFGLPFPEEYGGGGGGPLEMVVLGEELGRAAYDLAACYGLTVFCGLNLLRHGSEEQKRYYLPRIARGEVRFSISMTEPGAGSDAASLSTYAEKVGGEFVLNGQKTFCSGAGLPRTIVHLFARTDRNAPKHKGISLFLLDPTSPGVTLRRIPTLGRHILGTYEVFLDNVRVPESALVGRLNEGWSIQLSGLELERLFTSAAYVGASQAVIDRAVAYARERRQFGRAIGSFQAIAHVLADLQTKIDAARLVTYRAGWMAAQGLPCGKEVAMAKVMGSETYVEASRWGVQVLGGYGYVLDTHMPYYYADAVITTVTAGTSQIQRNIIARHMGLPVSY